MASANLQEEINKLATLNLFHKNADGNADTGIYVGRPFALTYDSCRVLIADAWKLKAKGLPHGAFLLAYYENEPDVEEALLLRIIEPTQLPTDNDVISSMIEYYKDNLRTTGQSTELDTFTKYEFSFSGLKCRVLGTFYKDSKGVTQFGADVENYYSAHNYRVLKPNPDVLEVIVNFREDGVTGSPTDILIGRVRYSSSRRFQEKETIVPVYVRAQDFLGKRTALFGMTRTGKSNTVKKIIQATVEMSSKAPKKLPTKAVDVDAAELEAFTTEGLPRYPAGQIIFDINGEYANPNLQDKGTAIFELFSELTTRYSTVAKPGFKVMKVNFYRDLLDGFGLVQSHLAGDGGDYVSSFCSIDLEKPKDYANNRSASTRYDRKVAAYFCCLYAAGFPVPNDFEVKFTAGDEVNSAVGADQFDPTNGATLKEATAWFTKVWENYNADFFTKYKQKNSKEWADEDLKAILAMLTRKKDGTKDAVVSGFLKLRDLTDLHTNTTGKSYTVEIIEELRAGKIIIIDLSQGEEHIQRLYSERICRSLFADWLNRFVNRQPNNFAQFYFEEAHNLFPKKEDKDLSQIYNRLAKEGAKLNIGMLYATQEVSSISSNILKNTQNWFIAHLNNEDETKEIKKYYDFGDFTDSLVKFSAPSDKGFVRMKTYSNPFVVPVQIGRFPKDE